MNPDFAAANHDTQTALVDETVLAGLRDILGPDMGELVHTYLDEIPKTLHLIHTAAGSHDETAVKRFAHSLKSSSANMGAIGLARMAAAIEEEGLGGESRNLEHRLHCMAQQIQGLRAVLLSYL